MLQDSGFTDVVTGEAADTFSGAKGEANARAFDVYGYAFERALYSRGATRLELIQELCRDGFPVPAPYGGVTA